LSISEFLPGNNLNIATLEERKLKEIEHSRRRRSILQGFERRTDTNKAEQVTDLDRLTKKKQEFDRHFSNMKFYSITNSSEVYYQSWLRQHCSSSGVLGLDYCCGNGECGLFMASCGASVIGIDISAEGIANANQNARDFGLEDICKFVVQDAETTSFPNDTFDVIVEYGALHHLDYGRAMKELCRILKPTGQIICIEALRHNPLFHLYRKLTPHLRTAWEVAHIIGVDQLTLSKSHFEEVNAKFFHLAVLAAVPFRRTRYFAPIRDALDSLDSKLLALPRFGKYGWQCVYTLSNPKK
jgi:ubiquinone/menaquinone biosynthesis C-methylase UbiE